MSVHTPIDLTITPRDRRFGRGMSQDRLWLGGDPVGTAFYNALSAVFPVGEAYFVESVRAFREGTSPKLAREINAFIKQEVIHSREHVSFNKRVSDAGYDISLLERNFLDARKRNQGRSKFVNLAATMAAEHFTAMIAYELLSNPKHLAGADAESARLWRWHALEEIEHKGVAYDTWLHATRDWSRWKRWKAKSLTMLIVSRRFTKHRAEGILELLRQDGVTGFKARWGLIRFAFGNPGMVRRCFFSWLAYFMPGFHPWKHDDRELIALTESEYLDALLPEARLALA